MLLRSRNGRTPLTLGLVCPSPPVRLQDGAVHEQQRQDGARGAGQGHDGHPEALHRLPHQQQAAQGGNMGPIDESMAPFTLMDGAIFSLRIVCLIAACLPAVLLVFLRGPDQVHGSVSD